MMQHLQAPPTATARNYAKVVSAFSILAVVIGIGLTAFGTLTVGELAVRTAMIALLAAAVVWSYSRLLRAARRTRPERMPMIHAAVSLLLMIGLYGDLALIFRGTAFGKDLPRMWWMIAFMLGMMTVALGFARRVGESLHCPKCEYEFGFDDVPNAPIRCPECGSGWLGMLKKGRRVKSPRLIAAGIALAVLSVHLGNPIFMRALAPHLPTPLLYAALYAAPGNMYTVWDELAMHPLDVYWTRIMAERVLACRAQDQNDSSPSRWFEAMIVGGKIPADLLERFYREGFRAELQVPARVKVGEPFTALLRVRHVASGSTSNVGLFFGGFTVGTDVPPVGRQDQTLWAFQLRPGVFSRHRDVLAQTLAVDHPGDIRVRVVYWVVYEPSFMDELQWQADGTPAKPARAVWSERVEVEKTVRAE